MKVAASLATASLALLLACGREAADDTPSPEAEGALPNFSDTPTLTPTAYTTALQFLPLDPGDSGALIAEFANLASSQGLNQHYLGWQLSRSGWRSILNEQFEAPPTRAPWRLFPAPSLRLTVTADGDPDALMLRVGSADYTLDLGDHLDGWEDRAGTRHDIREAIWTQRGQRVSGIAVQHRFAVPEPSQPTRFGPYERAVLRSVDGAMLVLFNTGSPDTYGDPFAWMYADGLTRRWSALETRTLEVANSAQLRRNVPIRTWFRIPEPDIQGELTAVERLFDELSAAEGPKPYNALYRVRGWIEFAGERRNVDGLLERGEL
ncbi:MAG: hypothetical protein JSV41_10930 [Gemmatimonadota bacterium]|nr:MAG: hypothetical protein JSV41_10930 [Gemmatimonadota bacterium]